MRTTLDIPDDVLSLAREIARREGSSMGSVLARLAREGLAARAVPQEGERRNGLRQVHIDRPVTAEDVAAAQDE